MFKKIVKFFILFGILLFSMICVSCKRNITPEEMIIQIYCDHVNSEFGYEQLTPEDVKIIYFLGQYGDAYCAYIENDRTPLPELHPYYITIEGELFEFRHIPEVISVYYNNKYYFLWDACEEGILSLEDVKALNEYCINYVYRGKYEGNI